MTREDFAEAVGWQLLCRCVLFDPAELREFLHDAGPFAREEPDTTRWARLFLVGRG